VEGFPLVDTGVDPAELADTLLRPLGAPPPPAEEARRSEIARRAYEAAYGAIARGGHDLVHNHAFDPPAVELARGLDAPVIHTLHAPPDRRISRALTAAEADPRPPVVVGVSESQCRAWAALNRVDGLLRPGVPTARIPWSGRSGDGLLFAGRLSPEKGVLDAIDIAAGSGRELTIAGGRYDGDYADLVTEAAGRASGVAVAGPLPRTALWDLMARSAALIFPIRWEEPFGMVSAEAQATGCPVIGYRRGALTEVIEEGVTGASVDPGDVEGARRALARIDAFDRAACRRHAEQRLDVAPMIEAHVALYEQVASRPAR
jgi:glycosyltransferase involved in cell wall biosynthesis